MDQKSVIGLAVTHTQSQIHSPGARTTFSMFRLVIYASKGLFHCESKSIWDGAHLLNFLPRQLNMTFNCHDSVHTQFILSPVLFMVHNNANMIREGFRKKPVFLFIDYSKGRGEHQGSHKVPLSKLSY